MGSFKIDQKFGSSGHPALTKPATRNDGEPPLRAGWRRPWPWHIDQFSGSRGSSDASNPRAGIPPGTILFAILGVYPLLLQKWLKLPVFLHFFCGWNQSLAVKRPPPALPKAPRPLSHRRTCSKVKPYLTGSFTTKKSMPGWTNNHWDILSIKAWRFSDFIRRMCGLT